VRFGDVKIGADVAVAVEAGGAVAGGGVDVQAMRNAALAQQVARGQEAATVGAGHRVRVPVLGAVRDAVAGSGRVFSF